VRSWHWISRVIAIGGVDSVGALDRPVPRHPLSKGLKPGRWFESVLLDGYDPSLIEAAPHCSLLDHVAKHQAYEAACDEFRHAFWRRLERGAAMPAAAEVAVERVLCAHGALRILPVDAENAGSIGLHIPGLPKPLCVGSGVRMGPWIALGSAGDYANLDALEALTLLGRLVGPALWTRTCAKFRTLVATSAARFARSHGYEGEHALTWLWLVQNRMLAPTQSDPPHGASREPMRSGRTARRERRRHAFNHYWSDLAYPRYRPLVVSTGVLETLRWTKRSKDGIQDALCDALYLLLSPSGMQSEDLIPCESVRPIRAPARVIAKVSRPSRNSGFNFLFGNRTPFGMLTFEQDDAS